MHFRANIVLHEKHTVFLVNRATTKSTKYDIEKKYYKRMHQSVSAVHGTESRLLRHVHLIEHFFLHHVIYGSKKIFPVWFKWKRKELIHRFVQRRSEKIEG
jgi:hypothetical protein